MALATTRPSLPTSNVPVTPSISISRCRIVSITHSPGSIDGGGLVVAALGESDGAVVGFERAQVVALADVDIAQQPVNLRMVRRLSQAVLQLRHELGQQIGRVLENRAVFGQGVVQATSAALASRVLQPPGLVVGAPRPGPPAPR